MIRTNPIKNLLRTRFAALATCLLFLASALSAQDLPRLKVGVYNIHGGVGSDGSSDLARIGRVLKSAAPEVVALNEVNRLFVGGNQDQQLAAQMGPGWQAVFGKTLIKPFPPADYGNAIITNLPIVSSQSWLLSEYPDQERRGLLRVTVQKGDAVIHCFAVHMGLDSNMRAVHAGEILNIMNSFTSGYKVLLGDFNEQRTGTSIEIFAAQLKDSWGLYGLGSANTFSATNPTRRIDFIWLDPRLAATSCYVGMHPDARVASDHLPLFAELVTPGAVQPVVNSISVAVNNQERLSAGDTVPPDPNAYTQGSVALVTSGRTAPCEITADNLSVKTLTPLYQQNFDTTPLGAAPSDWNFLYATSGKAYSGGTVGVGPARFWRQRSDGYAKYHYAPQPYPTWKDYEVSARIKTISTGGGVWRLLAYNYPADDTAYETYKIEVRHDAGALPQLRIMKGAAMLASSALPDSGNDPYDWNVYALQVHEQQALPNQATRHLTATVNGKRVAAATDTISGPANPDEYSQGSIVLTTIGSDAGPCEIYADDINVRQWQPAFSEDFNSDISSQWQHLYTSGAAPTTSTVPGPSGLAWFQSSAQYLKYHVGPVPYPQWKNLRFSSDVITSSFGGGVWRMNGFNYPASDTAYDTYKLEVNEGGTAPRLRIMKGAEVLQESPFSSLNVSPAQWQNYQLTIQGFQPAPVIIDKTAASSAVDNWSDF